MEELKSMVDIPASSLQEGFQATPLRKFIGTLDNYETEKDEQFDRIRVILQFTDLAEVEAVEPYPFPIAQITIPFSQRKVSAFGFLLKSIEEFIPNPRLSSLLKKRVRMELLPKNYGRWRGETEDRVRDTWVVTEIITEGVSETKENPYDIAIRLAVGVPAADLKPFHDAVFKVAAVKQDRELFGKILNKTFIPEAIERGDVVIDESGILTRPGEE